MWGANTLTALECVTTRNGASALDKLEKVCPKVLQASLETLAENGVKGDAAWEAMLLQTLCRRSKDPAKLLHMLQLYPQSESPESEVEFVLTDPVLWQSSMGRVDTARIYQRALVHERLVPDITAGEASVSDVCSLCRAVVTANSTKPPNLDDVLAAALSEVQDISQGGGIPKLRDRIPHPASQDDMPASEIERWGP